MTVPALTEHAEQVELLRWTREVVMARDCGCEAIRSELERYVKQYSRDEK